MLDLLLDKTTLNLFTILNYMLVGIFFWKIIFRKADGTVSDV